MTHLTNASHTVVIVKALHEKSIMNGQLSEAIRQFEVLDVLKGEAPTHISIKSGEQRMGDFVNITHGAFDFHQGDVYLLFLDKLSDDTYSPKCMSYYVFQEVSKHQKKYFVPRYQKGGLQILKHEKEIIHHVYDKTELIKTLKSHTDHGTAITIQDMKAPPAEQSLTAKVQKASPAHCSYLQSNNGKRYHVENLGSEELPVYYQNANSECSTVEREMQETVDYMNKNYKGINLTLGGSFSGYNVNCNNGRAYDLSYFGGTYDDYIDNRFNTKRIALVQFGDPCNEIPALNNCAGTVAKGGSWALGSHTADGESFNTAVYGYVVVNEGMGNCNCGDYSSGSPISDFSSIIAHELSHTIGLNHISSSGGSANMNPFSGSEITALDVECMDDLYPPSSASTTINPVATTPEPNPVVKPDLKVSVCGNISVSGNGVSISGLSIKNTSTANSGRAASVGFYVSNDSNITVNDRLVANYSLSSVAGGSTSIINQNFNISQLNLSAGQYHVGVIIDNTDVLDESNEGNNSCVHANAINIATAPVVSAKADLQVTDCGRSILSGNSLSITQVKVKNKSQTVNSEFSFIGYYLSTDKNITVNDIYLGYDYVPELSPGGQSSEAATFDLSQFDLGSGSYYIGIMADFNGRVSEANEANNTCHQNTPQSIGQSASAPADISLACGSVQVSDQSVSFNNVNLSNTGDVATSSFSYVAYYLSKDQAISNTDYLLGTSLVPVLSGGASSQQSASFNISDANLAPGDYYIAAVADYDGRINESNESNNQCVYQKKLTIKPEPAVVYQTDLIVECGTTQWNNQTLTISNAKVLNQGNKRANDYSYLAYYLSTDGVITTDDFYLGYDLVEKLRPNKSNAENASFDLRNTDIPDGEYFIGFIADFSDNVVESNNSNNSCASATAKVVIGNAGGVAEPGTISDGSCAEFDFNNFEDGNFGIWTDGGKDAFINAGVTFAHSGLRSVAIRGNDGIASSIYTAAAINMSGYQSLSVSFSFYSFLVERGDVFVLEVDQGSGYTVHQRWEANKDFKVGRDVPVQTTINTSRNTKLRIRAITSSNFEYIFLDDIKIERCQTRGLAAPATVSSDAKSSKSNQDPVEIEVYPSITFSGSPIKIDFIDSESHTGELMISDMNGRSINQNSYSDQDQLIIETDRMTQGMYIISIVENGKRRVEKIMITD